MTRHYKTGKTRAAMAFKSGLWFLVEINMAEALGYRCVPGGAFHTSAQGEGTRGDHSSSLSRRDQTVRLGQAGLLDC